jgi:hypothetical protein
MKRLPGMRTVPGRQTVVRPKADGTFSIDVVVGLNRPASDEKPEFSRLLSAFVAAMGTWKRDRSDGHSEIWTYDNAFCEAPTVVGASGNTITFRLHSAPEAVRWRDWLAERLLPYLALNLPKAWIG